MTSYVLQVGDPRMYQSVRRACDEAGLANPLTRCRDLDETHRLLGLHSNGPRGEQLVSPAVIVVDLRLGDGTALDLLREVRAHLGLRRTPVVVVGHDASDEEITEVHRWGQAAYLSAAMIGHTLLDVVRDMHLPWSLEAAPGPTAAVGAVGAAS